MPAYDAILFDPPAPLASVALRNPENRALLTDVPMLLDTGADVTLIPQALIDQLGIAVEPDTRYELMGFDGTVSLAPVVQLELIFLNRTFRGRFLLIGQEWGILGRDILNHVFLLLDGPGLVWNEPRPPGERG
ncbi:MAG: hypothetical protein EXS64_16665 [Candidatus Latescibacteria bacterium]|nr:hypothetical protein [Candidatus Latescibacterota bacterium]